MGFLNPLFLFGVFAAGVPLLIHLWSRRRARTLDFSTLRFLLEAHRRTVRRFRLQQWFILFLRALALILLAVSLARPVVHGGAVFGGARVRTAAVVILDQSASMGFSGVDGVPFESAKQRALHVIRSLREGDEASLVLMSDRATVLFEPMTKRLADVEQAVRSATLTSRATRIEPAWAEALLLLRTSDAPNRELYVVSDFAPNAWSEVQMASDDLRVFLIPVKSDSAPNASVEEVRPSNPLVAVGIPTEFIVTVRGYGEAAATRTLQFAVDGAVRATVTVRVRSSGTTQERIAHTFEAPGIHRVRASLDEDRFPVDDEHVIVVSVLGQIDALVMGEDTTFLMAALAPRQRAVPGAVYTIRPAEATLSDLTSASLDEVELLCFQDVGALDGATVDRLRDFLVRGGSALFFVGPQTSPGALSGIDWLPVVSNGVAVFETPAKLRPVHLLEGPRQVPAGSVSARVLGVFSDDAWLRASSPNVYRAHRLVARDAAVVVATLSTGEPAVVFGRHESGRVCVVNTSAWETDWSNWPLNPAFVPFVQQLVFELRTPDPPIDRSLAVGETFRRPARPMDPLAVDVSAPDGSRRTVGRSEDGLSFAYTQTEGRGVYELSGRRALDGALLVDGFAVNLPVDESDLRIVPRGEVARGVSGDVTWVDGEEFDAESLDVALASGRVGREVWPGFLLAALVVLLVETVLSNRGREADDQPSRAQQRSAA